MEAFLAYSIYFHAFCGFVALVAGGISMAAEKGRPLHRIAGKIYFGAMTGVFITAVYVAAIRQNVFLLMVGFFSYHMICSGYRALYLKKLHREQKPSLTDWFIASAAGIFNLILLGWGLYAAFIRQDTIGIVAMVFAFTGLGYVYADVKKFFVRPAEKNHWLISHVNGMIGGYIATWTAFLVVNITFLPALVLWLGPAAAGVPVIIYFIRKIKASGIKVQSIHN